MDVLTGFVCADVVTSVVTPYLQSVEAATTGSGIAAQLAGSDGGNNKSEQRAVVTKPQKLAN